TAPYAAVLLGLSLLTLWTSPALGGANDAEDCCLTVNQRPIPGNIVRAFRYLFLKDGCRVPVVVHHSERSPALCAPLHQPWVERIIQRLQKNSVKASLTLPSPASSLEHLPKTPAHDLVSPSSSRASATAVSP
uniref:Chemokine interleukin-8-like domain-containing protein n=1 Tax=Equus asinus TaxID=9793 RepID=A0A9L0IB96_EQUAS